ncbi:hypothetical protein [Longimicrobium sp.]|jgi:hypothetical protein|uniref:hypothetical protein n=1 Tax=Longimicrobium sp. TaxID=2029185 RepID=UPI002F93EBD0
MTGAAETLHPLPARAAVLRETLRAVGESVRLEMGALLLLLLGLAAVILFFEPVASPGGADYDVADMTWPILVLGLFAPLAVWKADEPSRRGYLWSMPVDRFRHTLMKAASGWAWLMGLVAVYVVWALSIPLLTGGHIVLNSDWETALLRGQPPGTVLRDMTLGGNPWVWVVPFVAASTGYFVGSAVALLMDHPLRVYAGVAFTFVVTIAMAEAAGGTVGHMADELFRYVVVGRYGLMTHATGIVFRFNEPLPAGQAIRDVPVFGAWVSSVLLWTGTGLAATLLAAYRHQER